MSSYKCSKCNYTSNTKGLVKKHIDNVSKCEGAELLEEIVKVQCDICNKEFDTLKGLEEHKKRCIKKKTIVATEFINPEKVEKGMMSMGDILLKVVKRVEMLEQENKELKKRLEKLEEKKKESVDSEDSEDLEEEEDDDAFCEHSKPHNFIPFTYENVVYNFNMFNCEDFNNVQITVEGQRDIIMEGSVTKHYIEVGGVEYFYLPQSGLKKRGKKYTDELKIVLVNHCQNKKLKGKDYCAEHKHKLKN